LAKDKNVQQGKNTIDESERPAKRNIYAAKLAELSRSLPGVVLSAFLQLTIDG